MVSALPATPDLPANVKDQVPHNFSLGTTQFCLGFSHNLTCTNLPLNLSDVFPNGIDSLLGDRIDGIRTFTAIFNKAFPWCIPVGLVSGLIYVLIVTASLLSSLLGRALCVPKIVRRVGDCSKVIPLLVLGMICCVLLSIPTAILFLLRSNTETLSAYIDVKHGEMDRMMLGTLCCTTLAMLMAFIALLR